MAQSKAISTAVYDSVQQLPSEICRVIAEYVELSHAWTAVDSTVDIVNKTADETRIIVAQPHPIGFRTIVSNNTVRTAHLHWTVDFVRQPVDRLVVGVGVTVRTSNAANMSVYFRDATDDRDWILMYWSIVKQIDLLHNHRSLKVMTMPEQRVLPVCCDRYRFVVAADPSTGKVTARLYQAADDGEFVAVQADDGGTDIVLVCAAADVFPLLRPCFVVFGSMDATVRSGLLE